MSSDRDGGELRHGLVPTPSQHTVPGQSQQLLQSLYDDGMPVSLEAAMQSLVQTSGVGADAVVHAARSECLQAMFYDLVLRCINCFDLADPHGSEPKRRWMSTAQSFENEHVVWLERLREVEPVRSADVSCASASLWRAVCRPMTSWLLILSSAFLQRRLWPDVRHSGTSTHVRSAVVNMTSSVTVDDNTTLQMRRDNVGRAAAIISAFRACDECSSEWCTFAHAVL